MFCASLTAPHSIVFCTSMIFIPAFCSVDGLAPAAILSTMRLAAVSGSFFQIDESMLYCRSATSAPAR